MDKEKFQNTYRIPSARLQNWDYGWAALYFITICTHRRICFFGNIDSTSDRVSSPTMQLSKIGEIVASEWLKTFELRQDMNLYQGEFVVMPNHFHAIIGIGKNPYNSQRGSQRGSQRRDAMHCVSTTTTTPEPNEPNEPNEPHGPKNKFGPQSKNLASIIRGFKSAVTIAARKINPDFKWQPRFHDHIIRNDDSFQRISNYIINNPKNWRDDKFHS